MCFISFILFVFPQKWRWNIPDFLKYTPAAASHKPLTDQVLIFSPRLLISAENPQQYEFEGTGKVFIFILFYFCSVFV